MKAMTNGTGAAGWLLAKSKKSLVWIILRSVVTALMSLLTVLLSLRSKSTIDVATGAQSGSLPRECVYIGLILAGEVLLMIVDRLLATYIYSKVQQKINADVFSSCIDKKYSELSKYHSGDILNRLTSDLDTVVSNVSNILPQSVYTVTKLAAALAAIAVLNPYLALIAVALGIIMLIGSRTYGKLLKKTHKEFQKQNGFLRSFLQECIENIVVIKSFSTKKSVEEKNNDNIRELNKLRMKRTIIGCFASVCMFVLLSAGYYAVMCWGAFNISKKIITYGTLMALLQLFQQVRMPLQNVSGIIPQYFSMLASAERIIEIEKLPTDVINNGAPQPFDFQSIEARNVFFRYNDEDDVVLQNAELSIKKGSFTLISGESGVGKSTFFKLVLSLYDYGGELYFKTDGGNIPISPDTRCMFAYVPQGNLLLSGSIRENICFGCRTDIGDREIFEALKVTDAFDIINSLPHGLDTVLGERGIGLSEGQLQRLAIARALLSDAPVLLLDECTSALDAVTEATVLNNIRALKTKTVILISHKAAALDVCDSIIRLENKEFSISDNV